MANRTCSIQDCGKAVVARNWCSKHYYRWHKYGDPLHVGEPQIVAVDHADGTRTCLKDPLSREGELIPSDRTAGRSAGVR